MLAHVEVDVGMIVGRKQTDAIKGRDADLDAPRAYRI